MKTRPTSIPVLMLALAVSCTSTPSGTDAGEIGADTGGEASPLVGSWFQQVTPATADNQTITITFAADGSVSFVHTQLNADTSTSPGCTETCTTPGTYTSTDTTVTMTADSAAATGEYSGCTDPTQDGPVGAMSCTPLPGTFDYTITGDMLTLSMTGASDVMLTRI